MTIAIYGLAIEKPHRITLPQNRGPTSYTYDFVKGYVQMLH